MTLEEINEMVKNRHSLTEEQKKQVRDAIINNDAASQRAIDGSISTGVTHSNHRIAIGSAILSKGIGEACKLLAEGIRWYNSVKK